MAVDPLGIAEEVGLELLRLAIGKLPELGQTLGQLVHDPSADELPLVRELRGILPAESAASRARRALEQEA